MKLSCFFGFHDIKELPRALLGRTYGKCSKCGSMFVKVAWYWERSHD